MTRLAALTLLLCSCANSQGGRAVVDDDIGENTRGPIRKGDPGPVVEFERGPRISDGAELSAWLERHRGERLRLPVVIEVVDGDRDQLRATVGEVELLVTDLALGVPLRERMAQRCGREVTRCALWLEGRYGERAYFDDPRPQLEVLEVRGLVDEGVALHAERAK